MPKKKKFVLPPATAADGPVRMRSADCSTREEPVILLEVSHAGKPRHVLMSPHAAARAVACLCLRLGVPLPVELYEVRVEGQDVGGAK